MNIFTSIGSKSLRKFTDERVQKSVDSNPCKLLPSGQWRVVSGPNIGLVFDRPVWVGAANNRHGDMGCDWYVWDGQVGMYGQEGVDQTVKRVEGFCRTFPGVSRVHFRYTGRTDITLAVLLAFMSHHINVVVEYWDDKKKGYVTLDLPLLN